MAKHLIITALVVLATTAAGAQTTRSVLPLPVSWGAVEVERFVETDGNPDTLEVLIWRYSDYQFRIVAVQPDGGLCAGPWFMFIHSQYAWPRFKRAQGVDVAFLTETAQNGQTQSYYFEVTLDHPTTCEP